MGKLIYGDYMNLERLIILREKSDLFQKDVAKILNVSQQTYSTWEVGTKIIPLKHLNKLANYFNVSLDYLTGLSDKKEKVIINKELDKIAIGQNLKLIRKENNLTLRSLAKELNTTSSTISAYETGKTLILTAFAYQICKKYKISIDWLLGKSNNKKIS